MTALSRPDLPGLRASRRRDLEAVTDPYFDAVAAEEPPDDERTPAESVTRLVDGGSFIHDSPTVTPALWGRGDEVLWSAGEPCLIVGPTGVGKTTLGGQIVAARMGLADHVLGFPVVPGRRVLYLAMDRPEQIRRALGRQLRHVDREVLADRLVVWRGPPMADLAKAPRALLDLAHEADADTVVIDSLKDAAIKLTDDEVGQGLSRAMGLCVATGVEVLGFHHQRKRGRDESKRPASVDDVYGSTWITAGAGSVIVLWGAPGDPVVELSHLKQPAAVVGPLTVEHDHERGTTRLLDAHDPLDLLAAGSRTASSIAATLTGHESPTRAEVEKVRRRLTREVAQGRVVKLDDAVRGGSDSGASGARYALAAPASLRPDDRPEATHEPTHTPPSVQPMHTGHDRRTREPVSAGQATHAPTHAMHAGSDARRPPPLKGGAAAPRPVCNRCEQPSEQPLIHGRCRRHAYPTELDPSEEDDRS